MKNAIVLGGTVPHARLIDKLKQRGYETWLVDYTANPPAKAHADHHIQESSLDGDAVVNIAKDIRAELVISTCIDQANSIACYAGEKIGSPIPYSYETSLDVTRKGRMKTIFKANEIPTSDFYLIDKDGEREIKMDFPLVIKPTDANSSKGVYKIENDKDFHDKIERSLSFSREGKAIVEGFVSGTEIQVDCIAVDGKAHVLMTRDKITLQLEGKELQTAGFDIPGKMCSEYKTELEIIAQKIVNAFELKNTPFFYQAICNSEGVYVLEFAPRIAGGTTYEMVEMYHGIDYLEAAIRSFLHEDISIGASKGSGVYVSRFLYMKPGTYSHVEGIDALLRDKEIVCYFPFVIPGKVIDDSLSSGNRIGAILVSADTYEAAENKINAAMQAVGVMDTNNEDLSRWK